jgi:hypothetical protein
MRGRVRGCVRARVRACARVCAREAAGVCACTQGSRRLVRALQYTHPHTCVCARAHTHTHTHTHAHAHLRPPVCLLLDVAQDHVLHGRGQPRHLPGDVGLAAARGARRRQHTTHTRTPQWDTPVSILASCTCTHAHAHAHAHMHMHMRLHMHDSTHVYAHTHTHRARPTGAAHLPAAPGLAEVLQDGLGLVLLHALRHHVQDVVHDGRAQLEVVVRLDALLGHRLGNALLVAGAGGGAVMRGVGAYEVGRDMCVCVCGLEAGDSCTAGRTAPWPCTTQRRGAASAAPCSGGPQTGARAGCPATAPAAAPRRAGRTATRATWAPTRPRQGPCPPGPC